VKGDSSITALFPFWNEVIEMVQKFYAPQISKYNRTYWEGLQQNKLLAQHCKACGERFYPSQAYCPACLSQDYDWFELSGKGTLYSWTEVLFLPGPPHIIGIIELDDEVGRSVALVEEKVEELSIGLQMKATFIKTNGRIVLGWKASKP
jgi:uncharacterized OB-fold protein